MCLLALDASRDKYFSGFRENQDIRLCDLIVCTLMQYCFVCMFVCVETNTEETRQCVI